nr:reverse transcriptase domain-containing protein [Tanacetum cinerariifolium]
MVDIPDNIDLVDYDEEDPEEDPEEEPEEKPKEDVDIELEDDAELIFPYEVEGDKTRHLEMCHMIRCHPSLSQRTRRSMLHPRLLLGLLPKSLMLFATFREAYLREKERELLNHDLENVERALGNVLERMSVLKSVENATLKKILAETETKLVWARMERETAERMLHESRVWNKRFYLDMPKAMFEARMYEIIRDHVTTSMAEFVANMNRKTGDARAGGARADGTGADGAGVGGAGPTAPEITGCTYITFMKCEPHPFKGTEGAIGLCQWLEKLEFVFRISDFKERDKVKFATATLQGRALTW